MSVVTSPEGDAAMRLAVALRALSEIAALTYEDPELEGFQAADAAVEIAERALKAVSK